MFRYLPEQASDFAHKVDYANYVVTDLSVFFTVAIVGTMLFFAIKYRQKNGVDHETPRIEGSNALEFLWTIIPTLIVIWVGYVGYDSFIDMRTVPPNAYEINVVGRKWAWDFEYKTGKKTTGELVVPVDEPVKLVMTSRDVLHSFFIPVMRTKHDVIPGRYTYVWFKPIMTGDFQVFCAEYCGNLHSGMLARLKVLPKAEFERWVNDFSEETKLAALNPADLGKELYVTKCASCHTLDGTPRVGPSWNKLFGTKHKNPDGTEQLVDENYIKDSILNPAAYIVPGFSNQMPSFAGQVSDKDIDGIIAFIKTLDGTQKVELPTAPKGPAVDMSKMSPAERGKAIFNDAGNLCSTCHTLDGTKTVGPSLKGVYGSKVKLADGTEVVADDAYIKESILQPQAKLVEGYGPLMPNMFQGKLSDENIKDITEFLKTLK